MAVVPACNAFSIQWDHNEADFVVGKSEEMHRKNQHFFFLPGKTLQVQPLHPPSAPLLAVAQISSRQSCQLQRECLLFSHSLWKESGGSGSGSHACIPGTCRPLSLGLWSFVFPTILSASWHQTGPVDVTAAGFEANTNAEPGTSWCPRAKPSTGKLRHVEVGSGEVSPETRLVQERSRRRWRSGSCRCLCDHRTIERSTKWSLFNIVAEGRGRTRG